MNYTENIGLKKPEGTDLFNIADFNENSDIIDSELAALDGRIDKLADEVTYYCNGESDNTDLREHLRDISYGCTVRVLGEFGFDGNTTTPTMGSGAYSLYLVGSGVKITLDFSQCSMYAPNGFDRLVYFEKLTVKGLDIALNGSEPTVGIGSSAAVTAKNCTLRDCAVSGSITGTRGFDGFDVTDSTLTGCGADISCEGSARGCTAENSAVTAGGFRVSSTGEASTSQVYAGYFSGSACRVSGCEFSAVNGSGGRGKICMGAAGGGSFTNCLFCAKTEDTGSPVGFFVNADSILSAAACTFRSCESSTSELGIALSGDSSENIKLFLNGVICDGEADEGYYSGRSAVFEKGEGVYSGYFFTAPEMPDTVVRLGAARGSSDTSGEVTALLDGSSRAVSGIIEEVE